MSYDMNQPGNGHGTNGQHANGHPQHMHPQHMNNQYGGYGHQMPQMQQQPAGVLYCNKHDLMINKFCMNHQVPLCQTCVRDHLQMQNQGYHDGSRQECDLLPIDQAINESLSRMQRSLQEVQEFIEFKKTINDFPDAETLQMYLQQNQLFENSYQMAHRYFIELQQLPDGQKELHLAQVNQSFIEEFKRFSNAKGVIEMITNRRPPQHGQYGMPNMNQNARQQASPAHGGQHANQYEDPEQQHHGQWEQNQGYQQSYPQQQKPMYGQPMQQQYPQQQHYQSQGGYHQQQHMGYPAQQQQFQQHGPQGIEDLHHPGYPQKQQQHTQQQKLPPVAQARPEPLRQNQQQHQPPQRGNHRGLRLTVRIDLQQMQQLNFEIEVDPNQSLKQLQQNIKDDVAKLESKCSQQQLDQLQIYLCADQAHQFESHNNTYEMIPKEKWGRSLLECGLCEGCVLYFSSRSLPLRQSGINKGYQEQKGVSRGPNSPGRQQVKLGSPRGSMDKNKIASQGGLPQKIQKPGSGKDGKKDDKKLGKEKGKKASAKKEVKTKPVFYRLFKPAKQTEADGEEGGEQEVPKSPESDFTRKVEYSEKHRLKNLKQKILEDLGMLEMCSIRLYKDGIPLLGDMEFVKDLAVERVEAELFYGLQIQVEGMGGQYQRQIEVSPNDLVDSIRNKVPFFSLFSQRNYRLMTDGGNPIERDQFATLHFRDSGLRNGSKLKMVPPQRERETGAAAGSEEPAVADEEAEEGMLIAGEGGEDEMLEIAGGEGGEDEMHEEQPDEEAEEQKAENVEE